MATATPQKAKTLIQIPKRAPKKTQAPSNLKLTTPRKVIKRGKTKPPSTQAQKKALKENQPNMTTMTQTSPRKVRKKARKGPNLTFKPTLSLPQNGMSF